MLIVEIYIFVSNESIFLSCSSCSFFSYSASFTNGGKWWTVFAVPSGRTSKSVHFERLCTFCHSWSLRNIMAGQEDQSKEAASHCFTVQDFCCTVVGVLRAWRSLALSCTITGLTTSTAINKSRGGKRWWSEIAWLSSSSARWEGRQRTCEEQACDDQVDWWQTENILSGLWQADGGARRARWGWRGFQLLLWTCFEEEDHDLILELEKYIDSFDHIMMCFRHLASPAFDAALMMFHPVFPPIQHDWRTVLF